MATNTKNYSLRLDEDTKENANRIFNDLGMDFSTGVRIYLNQVIKTNGIPFSLTNNESSLDRSISQMKNGDYKSFSSVEDLFKDLNDED